MKSTKPRRPIRRNVLPILALIGVFALVRFISTGGGGPTGSLSQAPVFELPIVTSDLSMEGTRLSDFAGQPLVVNFWASWCGVCKKEAKWLEDLHGRAEGALAIVSIASYDNPLDVRGTERYKSASYKIAIDPDGQVASHYQVAGLPASFLVDGQGRIQRRYGGPLTRARVDQLLQDVKIMADAGDKKPRI